MVERVARTTITNSSAETHEFAKAFGKGLAGNSVIFFYGDLGAGKTTFIKGLAAGILGTSGNEVTSPTFTYLNIYEGRITLYHFDLYRLKSSNEFLNFGFDEFFEAGGICCLEWAERIKPLIGTLNKKNVFRIEMICLNEESRQINIAQGIGDDPISV